MTISKQNKKKLSKALVRQRSTPNTDKA